MKRALLVVSVLLLLLGIATLVIYRYTYLSPDIPFVYRVDRWTGEVEQWWGGEWKPKK